jgi:quinol monooxygenase YgiN
MCVKPLEVHAFHFFGTMRFIVSLVAASTVVLHTEAFRTQSILLPRTLPRFAATAQEAEQHPNVPLASIMPYFKIKDWVAAAPIMEEFEHLSERANLPTLEHAWMSKSDDRSGPITVLRVSMHDADQLMDFYIDELSPLIDKLLQTAATIERIELHGISSEDKNHPYSELFETAGWFSKLGSDDALPKTSLYVRPYYTILDEVKAKPLMQQAIEEIQKEEGVLYFGWHREGNRAVCHGIFRDAMSFADHYKRVNTILASLLAGPATLEKIEVHGPDVELKKITNTIKTMKGVFKGVIVQEYSSDTGKHAMYIRE